MSADDSLAIYLQHRRELLNYASALLCDRAGAEDVVQDTWLKFSRLALTNIDQPVAYLFRMVRNLAMDQLRCVRRLPCYSTCDIPINNVCCQSFEPSYAAAQYSALERLQQILETLPHSQRQAFELHRLAGCTIEQIAQTLGTSVSTAHRLLQHAHAQCLLALDD